MVSKPWTAGVTGLALLALLVGLSQGPALVAASRFVKATERLNLRTCPATRGCKVITTLRADASLEVLEGDTSWLKVRVVSDGREGWVSTQYTRPFAVADQNASSASSSTASLWKFTLFLISAIFLMAFLMRKLSAEPPDNPIGLILISLLLGSFFLLNQFGPLLSRVLASRLRLDITGLSSCWTVNDTFRPLTYSKILLLILLLALAIAATAAGSRDSFLQGLGTGYLLLPATVLALGLAVAVGWLVLKILGFLFYLLKFLWIPVAWLFNHVVLPLLRFLGKPFVWIWEEFLREVLLFLATPFIWIWKVLLAPLLAFLLKYVLRPLLALAVGIAITLGCLFPIAIIGLSILDAVSSSLRRPLDPIGLFAQGMSTGFLLLDSTLLIILDRQGILHSTPPVTLLIMLALPVIVLLRLLVNRAAADDEGAREWSLKMRFQRYCKTSRIELLSACVILPALLVAQIMGEGDRS